jgi:DNA-binding MarR family transcriptional regulator
MATIDEEIKSKFMHDRHRFTANLVFTAGWIKNLITEFLKPYGISSPQFNILRILRGANDWVAMSEVKNLMVEKAPNATRLADKLLDKELIERQRSDADRRVVYVRISNKGLKLLKKIDDNEDRSHIEFMERITDKEARQMNKILDKMRG